MDKAFRAWLRAWYGNAVELSKMARAVKKMMRLNLARAFRKWQDVVGKGPPPRRPPRAVAYPR